MIRILIANDHPLVREGLKTILREHCDMEVCCEATEYGELIQLCSQHHHDIVVMDISMSGKSGLDALKELRDNFPDIHVLVLSMHPEERFAVRAIRTGARGYLSKESAPQQLVTAIRKVAAGGRYITEALAEQLATDVGPYSEKAPHEILSNREFQVLCGIASGKTYQEIADDLCVSQNTVNTYRARILEKMKLKNNIELAHYAIRNNLID